MPAIYLYRMLDNPFDIAVLVVAMTVGLVAGIMRWPWWLPIAIALFATVLTHEGDDVNFWLIGFPVYAVLVYADYGTGRLIGTLMQRRARR